MKNLILLVSIFSCFCFSALAQMDNLINLSANWIASPARNAATEVTDIVVYNPAATASLSNGIHINIGNQSLFRTPTHTYDLGAGPKTCGQSGSDPFLPNIYAAFAKNNWSLFTGIFISGGGAALNYPEGSLITDLIGYQSLMSAQGAYSEAGKQYLKASSYYLTSTIGASYKFNEVIAASIGLRYLNGMNKTEAGMTLTASPIDLPDMPLTLETEEKANAINAVIGIAVHPTSQMGITLRYESKAKLDFKTKLIKDDFGFVTDGSKSPRDLPSVLAFGVSFKFNDKLTFLNDINYYFQENADWGKTSNANGEEVSLSKAAGNALSYCWAIDYQLNEKLLASVGFGLTDYLYNDIEAYYSHIGVFETVQNDNVNLNLGGSYKLSNMLTMTAGFMHTYWAKDTKVEALMISPGNIVTINNAMNAVAVGAEIKF